MRLRLAAGLQAVPDLDAHEITAAQLATNGMDGNPIYKSDHIGRIVAVKQRGAMIAGRLESVTDAGVEPFLVLQIGDFRTAVHPAHPVTVAPAGCRLTITATAQGNMMDSETR